MARPAQTCQHDSASRVRAGRARSWRDHCTGTRAWPSLTGESIARPHIYRDRQGDLIQGPVTCDMGAGRRPPTAGMAAASAAPPTRTAATRRPRPGSWPGESLAPRDVSGTAIPLTAPETCVPRSARPGTPRVIKHRPLKPLSQAGSPLMTSRQCGAGLHSTHGRGTWHGLAQIRCPVPTRHECGPLHKQDAPAMGGNGHPRAEQQYGALTGQWQQQRAE